MNRSRSRSSDNGSPSRPFATRSSSFEIKSTRKIKPFSKKSSSKKTKRKHSNKKLKVQNYAIRLNRGEIEFLNDDNFERFLKGNFGKFKFLCYFYFLRDLQKLGSTGNEKLHLLYLYETYISKRKRGLYFIDTEYSRGLEANEVFESEAFVLLKGRFVLELEKAHRVYGLVNLAFGEIKVKQNFYDLKIKEKFRQYISSRDRTNDLEFLEKINSNFSENIDDLFDEYCSYKKPKTSISKNILYLIRKDKKKEEKISIQKTILNFIESGMIREYEVFRRKMKIMRRIPVVQITFEFLLENPMIKFDFLEFLFDLNLASILLFYLDYHQFQHEDDMFLYFKMKKYFFNSFLEYNSDILSECNERDISEDSIRELCEGVLEEIYPLLCNYAFQYYTNLLSLGIRKMCLDHEMTDILLYPTLYQLYYNFLKVVEQETYLHLYKQIHEYTSTHNTSLASEIYDEFLFENKSIKLSGALIKHVKENLENPPVDVFDDILATISKGLEKNFSKFLNAEEPKQKKYSITKYTSAVESIYPYIDKISNKKLESKFMSQYYILSSYSNVPNLYLTDIYEDETMPLEIPSGMNILSYACNNNFIYMLIGKPFYVTVYDIALKQFNSQQMLSSMTDEDKNQFVIESNSRVAVISSEKRMTNVYILNNEKGILSFENHFSIKRKSGQALKQNFTKFLNHDLILLASHSSIELLRLDTLETSTVNVEISETEGIMKIYIKDSVLVIQTTYSIFTFQINALSVTPDVSMKFEFPIGSCLYHSSGVIYIGSFNGYLYSVIDGEIAHVLHARPIIEEITGEAYLDLSKNFTEKILRIESQENKIIVFHNTDYVSIWKHTDNLPPALLTTCDIPVHETQYILNNTIYSLGPSKITKIGL